MLNEMSWSQEDKYCDSTYKKYLKQSNRNKEWWLPGIGGGGNWELLFNGYRVSVFTKMKGSGDLSHNNVNTLNTTELNT